MILSPTRLDWCWMFDVGRKKSLESFRTSKEEEVLQYIEMFFFFSTICLSDPRRCGWFLYFTLLFLQSFSKNLMKLKKFQCIVGYAGGTYSIICTDDISCHDSSDVGCRWKKGKNVSQILKCFKTFCIQIALFSSWFMEMWLVCAPCSTFSPNFLKATPS